MIIKKIIPLIFTAFLIITLVQIGCDELITEQIFITEAGHPISEFGLDSISVDFGCAPLTVGFEDRSDGPRNEWLWDFGDGETSTDTNPVHTYVDGGFYTVSLKITDTETGGVDTEVEKRYIYVGTSSAEFTADVDSGCVGLEVTFTPALLGANRTYKWDFGDNTGSVDSIAVHTFDSSGLFEVVLDVTDSCGTKSDTVVINVTDCPIVAFSVSDNVGCVPLTVSFINESYSVNSNYVIFPDSSDWKFGDGSAGANNTANPTYIYETPGLYTVTLTVVGEGGTSTDSLVELIEVYDTTRAGFDVLGDTMTCHSDFLQHQLRFFNNTTGRIDSVYWNFGDGTSQWTYDTTVWHAYIDPNIYTVEMIAVGYCGVDTTTRINLVHLLDSLTLADAGFTTQVGVDITDTVTIGSAMSFIALSGPFVQNWNWDFGDATTGIGDKINHTYDTPGTYEVLLTIDNMCNQIIGIDTVIAVDSI